MNDRLKSTTRKSWNFVKTHKYSISMTIITAMLLAGSIRNAKGIDEFLTEKGIDPREFWLTPEDFASLNKA